MHTKALPSPESRHPALTYAHDTRLGDYIFSPSIQSWTYRRLDAVGNEFLLMGRGTAPSQEQIQKWEHVEKELEQLVAAATSACTQLLVGPEPVLFTLSELMLREVRFELDDSVILFFSFPREEEVWMWPMVTFKDFKLVSTEWTV
jgi:hypothetical protein